MTLRRFTSLRLHRPPILVCQDNDVQGLRNMQKVAQPRVPEQVNELPEAAARPAQTLIPWIVPGVWHDALFTFGSLSGPILICALLGFAGVTLAGAAVGLLLFGGSWERRFNSIDLQQFPLMIQGLAGWFTLAFARGAITRLALRAATPALNTRARLRDAYQAALAQWPTLLASTLAYGALTYAGISSLSEMVPDLRRDTTTPRYRAGAIDSLFTTAGTRFLQATLPDPDAPFAQKLAWDRLLARRRINYSTQDLASTTVLRWMPARPDTTVTPATTSAVVTTPSGLLLYPLRSDIAAQLPAVAADPLVMGLAGMVLILVTETLLRMRSVMAMRPGVTRPCSLITPLMSSARFGLQHFAPLTAHIWLLRGAICAASFLFILLPLEVTHNGLVPALVRLGSTWAYTTSILVIPASLALVTMVLNAFSLVYDVSLYSHLRRQAYPPEQDAPLL